MSDLIRKFAYGTDDIMKICQVDRNQVDSWLKGQKLPFVEVPGGHKRVSHQHLESFMQASKMTVPAGWSEMPVKCRILVVEDDVELVELLLDILRDEPEFEVCTESDGVHAVLKASSWVPDLVMLDFVIPGLNGFEVCKRLRENEATRDIPVLAVTSLGNTENRKSIFEAGVSDYLPKPFYSEELLKRIRALLAIESK